MHLIGRVTTEPGEVEVEVEQAPASPPSRRLQSSIMNWHAIIGLGSARRLGLS